MFLNPDRGEIDITLGDGVNYAGVVPEDLSRIER